MNSALVALNIHFDVADLSSLGLALVIRQKDRSKSHLDSAS